MERPSPVLLAMGRNEFDASNSVRVSFSWDSKESDVTEFIAAFRRIIDRVKPTLKGIS
jgi:cysteine sulfinate desulfinase/cysteine desulfurase-like protein